MAVGETFDELPQQTLDVGLCEFDKARVQQAHEIMVTVLKHQVERT